MKKLVNKKLSSKQWELISAVVLGLIAFALMFAPQLGVIYNGKTEWYVWSKPFFDQYVSRATLSFIGYIFIASGSILLIANIFIKSEQKIIKILLSIVEIILLITGAFFVFFIKVVFVNANGLDGVNFCILAAPILAGILAIIVATVPVYQLFKN